MQDLSLHILDIAENGINAGANLIQISIEEDLKSDRLLIIVEDNGSGMQPEFVKKALDPFVTTRTTRKVGLGLSLFQQAAQAAEGDLKIESTPNKGTKILVYMRHSHIDRKPMGNMPETIITLIQGNPKIDFVYSHKKNGKGFSFDTRDLRAELEEIPLNHPQVLALIKQNLISEQAELVENS